MYFIELIGFIQYYGVLKRPFLKECVPKKCREIYAQIPPQVGFVPPHLYPPYGGGTYLPPWENLYGQPWTHLKNNIFVAQKLSKLELF